MPVTAVHDLPVDDDVTSVLPLNPQLPGPTHPPAPAVPRGPGPAAAGRPTIMVRPKRAGRGLVVVACVLAVLLAAGVGLLVSGVFHRSPTNAPTATASTTPPATRPPSHHHPAAGSSSTTTSSTTTSTTQVGELGQAQAISAIATQSGSARASVQNAVADIGACGPNMAANITTLQGEASTRQQLAGQLGGLAVGGTQRHGHRRRPHPGAPGVGRRRHRLRRLGPGLDGLHRRRPGRRQPGGRRRRRLPGHHGQGVLPAAWAPLAQALGLPAISADQI